MTVSGDYSELIRLVLRTTAVYPGFEQQVIHLFGDLIR